MHFLFLMAASGDDDGRNKVRLFLLKFFDLNSTRETFNTDLEKLKNNKFMEALRDRTIKIDIPYLLRVSEEKKVYDHFYNSKTVHKHIAPHTTKIAAMFAVVSRASSHGLMDEWRASAQGA